MKKIALWLAAMALGLCLGCAEPKPVLRVDLKFRQGQTVNLVIGGKGQIIEVDNRVGDRRPYRVRIRTDEGSRFEWFHEFELEITP
jgi:hypothetical protein